MRVGEEPDDIYFSLKVRSFPKVEGVDYKKKEVEENFVIFLFCVQQTLYRRIDPFRKTQRENKSFFFNGYEIPLAQMNIRIAVESTIIFD